MTTTTLHYPRGWKPRKPTPWRRAKPAGFKATNGKVRAYIDTASFTGVGLGFDNRDALLTFVRTVCEGEAFVNGRIYGGGFDADGGFLLVGAAVTRMHYGLVRGTGRTKLVIEQAD